MNRKGKSILFIVAALIFALTYTAFMGLKQVEDGQEIVWFKGAEDIRYGIDIRGGVEATFVPETGEATDEEMLAAEEVIKARLLNLNITDYEVYTDFNNDRLIVRFPWKEGETEFNPQEAIDEIGASAVLTFREGLDIDENGLPAGNTKDNIILVGEDIESAESVLIQDPATKQSQYVVELNLTGEGAKKFEEATTILSQTQDVISIWMDDTLVSYPQVDEPISGGTAIISGSDFDSVSTKSLANTINAGSLPFSLTADNFSSISPTLGAQSLEAMLLAGGIAFLLVALYIMFLYKLPGVIAVIALMGQVAATIAFISGFFPDSNSFTMTLPGIAGIILAIGIGVDANIITFERIKEELKTDKTLEEALTSGFSRGLAPIIDGNITVLIIAVILMGAFGPTDSIFSKIFFMFGASTSGTIYAFGYTLLIGVLLNFVMGICASRLMLRAASKFKAFGNLRLYGFKENQKQRKEIDFIKNRKKFFAFSGVLIAVIIAFSLFTGVKTDIQFTGGAIMSYEYTGELEISEIEAVVDSVLQTESTVQTGNNLTTGQSTFSISLAGGKTITTQILTDIDNAFSENFQENNVLQLEVNNVDPVMGNEFMLKSVLALIIASALILGYITIRFSNIGGFSAGAMAVVALIHDLIMIFGVFVICGFTINGNFIAAMLTILGYSINDTVVVYDRIRENKLLHPHIGFEKLVNLSINQSLVRSVNTTVSTVIALGVVCIVALMFNLNSILTFAFPMTIGMISGVYSTICIAGPLWVEYELKRKKPEVDEEVDEVEQ